MTRMVDMPMRADMMGATHADLRIAPSPSLVLKTPTQKIMTAMMITIPMPGEGFTRAS